MQFHWSLILFILPAVPAVRSLNYDPDDYIEVYPDPRDPDVLKGRTPLHFALIQSLGMEFSQLDGSGVLAGVKVALDRINNDSSLLDGYTLHYTFTNSKVIELLHSELAEKLLYRMYNYVCHNDRWLPPTPQCSDPSIGS